MKISFKGSPLACEAREGETILLACARSGVILSAPCGGRGRCGKCRVHVLSGEVSGEKPDGDGWVRACASFPVSDIVLALPESSAILGNEVSAPLQPAVVRPSRAGVALDIGTTTVSARLVDLDTAAQLDTISELNDQRVFGADVMSRIGKARQGQTKDLYSVINRQTERILRHFIERWNLPRVEKLAVAANTTMLHLFLNEDPSGMGEVPFTPVFLEERELKGAALSLSAETVTVLPSISAFIGGDITAGLGVLDILQETSPSLLIDIGTNGEMALFNPALNSIVCCSTAAGPAFEGAEISCGMGGIAGAISGVQLLNGELSITTIGEAPARGICGSGLIDAVAVMLKQGIVDETGLMENHPDGYELAPGVSLINRDIRQFQLAKSAILSGIRILCKSGGLKPEDVKNVYIAGGFGFFINKQNAIASGIFPAEFSGRISICGNLSLQGAEDSLAGEDFMERCRQLIKRCSVIELNTDPAFMDEFAENMLFGDID